MHDLSLDGLKSKRGAEIMGGSDARALYALFERLYVGHNQYEKAKKALGARLDDAIRARPEALRLWDQERLSQDLWFAQKALAYCTYIDRFAGTFGGLMQRLDYLQELGVTLIHPLPCLKARPGDSDGGFAVADFRDVAPELGSFEDLVALSDAARARGQALILDIVCNHTAKEHEWAQGFVSGDPRFADFYIKIDDQAQIDEWEANLI